MQQPESAFIKKDESLQSTTKTEKALSGWYHTLNIWWDAILFILPLFAFTRLLFILLTYLGVVLFTIPNFSHMILSSSSLLYSWYRWDAVRFSTIASNGYVSLEYAAFYPLYPMLESIISNFFHHNTFVAGIIISNIAFVGVLVVLYRFVVTEFNADLAKRTTLYLNIFPTTFFFSAAYNESLFLLFLLLSYTSMHRGSWWRAGLFGGLAALTRSAGIMLAVVFLYEFACQSHLWTIQIRSIHYPSLRLVFTNLLKISPVLWIPLGVGLYSLYLNQRFQDPFAFFHAQAHWREGLHLPLFALILTIQNLRETLFTFIAVHSLIDLIAFLLFLLLLILCFVGPKRFVRRLWGLPILGLLMLCLPLLFPGLYSLPLLSMQRFVLEIPAGFIMLAQLGKRSQFHLCYLIATVLLLAFFLLQYTSGRLTV